MRSRERLFSVECLSQQEDFAIAIYLQDKKKLDDNRFELKEKCSVT